MRCPWIHTLAHRLMVFLAVAGMAFFSCGVSCAGESDDAPASPSLAAFLKEGLVLPHRDAPSTASSPSPTTHASKTDDSLTSASPGAKGETDDPSTRAGRALLDRIERRHGHLKTLTAQFDQILVTETFGEEIASRGELYLQMPDRLRCDYLDPDAATLLFVNDTMYVYVPKNEMVDKYTYPTEAQAREKFKLVMLGFGVSSEETLASYRVRMVSDAGDEWTSGTALRVLDFEPRDPELAKSFREIRVGFDPDTLLPRRVRFGEVGGEVRTLTIRRIVLDDPISAEKFSTRFPGNPEIVEH